MAKEIKTESVTDFFGNNFFVKTSHEFCGKSFTEKISRKKGRVIGTGPSEKDENDFWVSLEGDGGKVRTLKSWEKIILDEGGESDAKSRKNN